MSRRRKANGSHHFDEEAADRVVKFYETYLFHVKGEWAGQRFKLLDWQSDDVIRPLFGWKNANGTRKYRTAYIEVPSKNGKSNLAAGAALYLTFGDKEYGAEVYSAAGDKNQAGIVFNLASSMVEKSRPLYKRSKLFKKSIFVPRWASSYQVLSSDAFSKHGYNVHGLIFDELHVQPNRELWDTLTNMTGARRQPLVMALTTAGVDRNSLCYEIREYAKKVIQGVIEDPTFFAYIRAAKSREDLEEGEEEPDWTDPKVWREANPSYNITVKGDFIQNKCNEATQSPALENTFRQLHLNQWVQQTTRWLPLRAWDKCAYPVEIAALQGRTCYGGLDLANVIDLAALVLVFPPREEEEQFILLPFFWCPQDGILERSKRDKVRYDLWVKQGLMIATEGNVIDYKAIKTKIVEMGKGQCAKCHHLHAYTDRPCSRPADGSPCTCPESVIFEGIKDFQPFKIDEIAFDRWGSTAISTDLQDEGFTMVQFGQGFASMSPPTKELLKLVLSGKLSHGGHKVLRWNADNLVVRTDAAGNLKPDRQKSTEKIDGMVASIMGLDRAVRKMGARAKSIYEERGLLTL